MDAAVYLRISEDRSGEQLGVTRHREDCLALCQSKGWHPVEYLDNDTSATSGKPRPAYEKMLADVREGRLGAVVAWDLDRLPVPRTRRGH
jgi:DNA invertase Pin-like site-specific DNA recombinase